MPLNQRMDNENVVHLYNRVLLSGKKKKNDILQWKWMEVENPILFVETQTQNQENSITHSKVDTTYKATDNKFVVHNHREAR